LTMLGLAPRQFDIRRVVWSGANALASALSLPIQRKPT
jgi:hypothetical protein